MVLHLPFELDICMWNNEGVPGLFEHNRPHQEGHKTLYFIRRCPLHNATVV